MWCLSERVVAVAEDQVQAAPGHRPRREVLVAAEAAEAGLAAPSTARPSRSRPAPDLSS
ncbi:MAG TPA: hypothetical protein VGL46_14415 [Pseudonocardiaceae bacterium]